MCASVDFLCVSHECVMDLHIAQPCFQFCPVATCGITSKKVPSPEEHFHPSRTVLQETSVKLLTGHFQMQTSSSVSLFKHASLTQGGFVFVKCPSSRER